MYLQFQILPGPFNRTILELKLMNLTWLNSLRRSFNRTILELKQKVENQVRVAEHAFNRTILELKLFSKDLFVN